MVISLILTQQRAFAWTCIKLSARHAFVWRCSLFQRPDSIEASVHSKRWNPALVIDEADINNGANYLH
jgi:hypothetical protein